MPHGMQLPQLLTPQQKDEQYQAIKSKLTVKSSLTEQCDKHQGFTFIFESSKDLTKYCEKCFQELLEHHQTSEGHPEAEVDQKNLEETKTSQSQLSQPDM